MYIPCILCNNIEPGYNTAKRQKTIIKIHNNNIINQQTLFIIYKQLVTNQSSVTK